MRTGLKKIVIIAAILILAAAIIRTCRNATPQSENAHRPSSHTSSAPRSESTSFWSFLDGVFGSSEKKKEQEADADGMEDTTAGPLRSELNVLSERLEKEEKLPDSVWYPNSTDKEEIERHTALLREMLLLGTLVRNGTASSEQRDRYYDIKLKLVQEKLELIKDYRQRYREFADPEDNDQIVVQLQNEISRIKAEMKR
jgi:hypothetical protein